MMKYALLFTLCLFHFSSQAQYRIKILNPSFEKDNAKIGVITQGWFSCGEGQYSPPDLHSDETSFFNVRDNAAHGENYISMVARKNKFCEAIGQRLPRPLDKYRIHHIAFRAKLSRTLRVYNQNSHNLERYNQPVIIQMWAGNSPGSKKEFLGATEPLNFKKWEKVNILFRPSKRYRFICFDAHYASEDGSAYNGNVLLDRFSPISIVMDTVRYKPVCVDGDVLKVIDEKRITEKELERLSMNYLSMLKEYGRAASTWPKHVWNITQAANFQWRKDKAGLRKYLYTEKTKVLLDLVRALDELDAKKEAEVLRSFLNDPNNLQDDHFSRKASRKLGKQFSKVEQIDLHLFNYIQANRRALLKEFSHCEVQGGIKL